MPKSYPLADANLAHTPYAQLKERNQLKQTLERSQERFEQQSAKLRDAIKVLRYLGVFLHCALDVLHQIASFCSVDGCSESVEILYSFAHV